ncbi:MAG: hypothetical protein ACHQX0_08070, partial [Desulfobaccales bacterium]
MKNVRSRLAWLAGALLLCLGLHPRLQAASPSSVSITKTASPNIGLHLGDVVHVCLNTSTPIPKADILWVIDVSTSMNVGLNNIIANINTFTTGLASQGIDYRDDLFIYTGDQYNWYYGDYGWAPDNATFSANLNNALTQVSGGIEWSMEAVLFANNKVSWRPGASRNIVLITDEALPCKETGYIYPMLPSPVPATLTEAGTAAVLTSTGATLYSISKAWPGSTDPEGRCDPETLPAMTGGLWLDYSTPTSGWSTLLNTMANAIKGLGTLVVSDPLPWGMSPV